MKKLLHERLREYSENRYVYSCNTKDIASVIGVGTDCRDQCSECRSRIYEALADEIERYYIPRLRFEDGKPVQFGDKTEQLNGVEKFIYTRSGGGSCQMQDANGNIHNSIGMQPIKRPSPKVFDADGVEIKVGDTVWDIKGDSYKVINVGYDSTHAFADIDGNDISVRSYDVKRLTHKEPDSLDKVIDDLRNNGTIYARRFADRLTALIERVD